MLLMGLFSFLPVMTLAELSSIMRCLVMVIVKKGKKSFEFASYLSYSMDI